MGGESYKGVKTSLKEQFQEVKQVENLYKFKRMWIKCNVRISGGC